jgi:hypothetical protein
MITAFISAMNLLIEKNIVTKTSNRFDESYCKFVSVSTIEDKIGKVHNWNLLILC